jgi:hypothetical protein
MAELARSFDAGTAQGSAPPAVGDQTASPAGPTQMVEPGIGMRGIVVGRSTVEDVLSTFGRDAKIHRYSSHDPFGVRCWRVCTRTDCRSRTQPEPNGSIGLGAGGKLEPVVETEDGLARTSLTSGTFLWPRVGLALLVALGVGYAWTSISLSIAEVDPLGGAVGALVCPGLCRYCAPPMLAVSWSTTTRGSSSEQGVFVCGLKNEDFTETPRVDLALSASRGDPELDERYVPFAEVMLLLSFPVFVLTVAGFIALGARKRLRLRRVLLGQLGVVLAPDDLRLYPLP